MKSEINADMTTQHEFIFVRARNSISQLRRHRARNTNKFVKGADTKRLKANVITAMTWHDVEAERKVGSLLYSGLSFVSERV